MNAADIRLSQSVWRDLERRLGTSDLVEWLEREAERLAQLGRSRTGRVDFSPALLRDRRIGKVQAKPNLPALATIRWQPSGYEIAFASFHRRIEDRRFAIAHEIAHTFWFAPGSMEPLSPLQGVLGDDRTVEWLCNRTAAAMLVPRSDVLNLAREMPRILHHVPVLAKRYLVPERLVARRLYHELSCATDFCIVAVGTNSHGDEAGSARIAWCAQMSSKPTQKKQAAGRVVPAELLPNVNPGDTHEVGVDGRWWVLMDSLVNPSRAKPLDQYPAMPIVRAWAAKTGGTVYLALSRRDAVAASF